MYRRNPLRSVFQGLAGGAFLIGLAIAFWASSQFSGDFFLPILFWALAFSSLFGSLGSLNPRHMYGAVSGFVFMLGLGILFLPGVSFFPGILILVGITAILGAIARPILIGLFGAGAMGAATMFNQQPQQPPYYQPPPQPQQDVPYQPYQQGYQPPEGTYQGGGGQRQYPPSQPQPKYDQTQYEEPQAHYPQELPPQQQ